MAVQPQISVNSRVTLRQRCIHIYQSIHVYSNAIYVYKRHIRIYQVLQDLMAVQPQSSANLELVSKLLDLFSRAQVFHFRANLKQLRQSKPDSGLVLSHFQGEGLSNHFELFLPRSTAVPLSNLACVATMLEVPVCILRSLLQWFFNRRKCKHVLRLCVCTKFPL